MSNYRWLTEESLDFLKKDYLLPGQTVDERVDIICRNAERILNKPGYAAKLKDYFQRGWYSFSTPIWANFGTDRGLPISCFNSYIEDSMDSILYAQAEVGMMTKVGGGASIYVGNLRHRGAPIKNNGFSSGAVHFCQLFEKQVEVISQGSTRRGSVVAYIEVDHPDFDEFIGIRGEGHALQQIHSAVIITDDFMERLIARDPEAMRRQAKIIEARLNRAEPYVFFVDNVNRGKPDVYKDKNMKIHSSNLCIEICLPSSADESFVCDLSSMNIRYFDEWKDTDAVEVLVYLLDAVMTEFIEKARGIKFLERAVKFAERHRALGVGWFGWHSYLQSNMIPFESFEAKQRNVRVAKNIYEAAYAASAKLAQEYGEPELLKGYGRRNTTLLAIAPTKSSAFIIGQESETIEPFPDNYGIRDYAKGKYTVRNKYLMKLLEEKGKNTEPVWRSILEKGGSVQHLDFLSSHEKAVFKTFSEISQKEIIIQASQRQKWVDQGQSLNLMIDPNTVEVKDINALMIEAWRLGVKSLYYQHGVNAAQEFSRKIMECSSCEA